jgi:alpha-beta hydrolase superfamily lysophospholipase
VDDTVAQLDLAPATARFIDGVSRPLFLWHHAPADAMRRGAAVVLCPPLGYEYMSAYRTWRVLAQQLSAVGFDVIRFDYDGTGNSAGISDDPQQLDAWIGSISCAMAEARRVAGSSRLALVGLRTGATLALEAAASQDQSVDRLVLWSPFESGRAWLREAKAFARLSRQDHAVEEESTDGSLNGAGHILPPRAVAQLQRWDVHGITTPPARDVLVVDRDDRQSDTALDTHLSKLGCRVSRVRPPGTAAMLAPPQLSVIPVQALTAITEWLQFWRLAPAPSIRPQNTEYASRQTTAPDRYRDEPVQFGPGERLFGILTNPYRDDGRTPAVLLFNTGWEHHVGPHRMYVPLAREWAAAGHPVLRFDIGGIGDSDSAPDGDENLAYPSHMLDDARAAMTFLLDRVGRRPLIAIGLCSGGWLAYRAACEGLPVDAIVAVNAPLYLREGAASRQWLTEVDELQRYQQSLREPAKWGKALLGKASYATFARLAAAALRRQVKLRVAAAVSETLPSGLGADLQAISARGIDSLFVFSSGDGGLDYFQLHATPALRRADIAQRIRSVIVDGAGHSFRPPAAQRQLRELLTNFVSEQTTASPADDERAGR